MIQSGSPTAASPFASLSKAAGRHGRKHATAALLAPLFLFLFVGFFVPVAMVLWRSIENPEIPSTLPRTVAVLSSWDGTGLPSEQAFEALAQDLAEAQRERQTGVLARRLNIVKPGYRTLVQSAAVRAETLKPPYQEGFARLNAQWAEREIWLVLKRLGTPVTADYLLSTVDLQQTAEGIGQVEDDRAIYRAALARTLWISVTVCLLCLLLGFPIAFLIAAVPRPWSNILMGLVLLPFWMSLLARTAAWVALLQSQGLINKLLMSLSLIDEPLALMFNRTGVLIAMTHVLLPYMVLPLYATMRTVPVGLIRAGLSLGASPFTVFRRIFLPLVAPGTVAGALLVLILSLGYYITPALVGGTQDQMLAYFIAFNTSQVLNWGLAAALGVLLLAAVAILFALYRLLARGAAAVEI